MMRPGWQVTVYVEEPIETEGMSDADIPELARRVQEVVTRRVDRWWEVGDER